MELLDFLNTHEDWEEQLTQEPYCLTISKDNDYVLFKYNAYASDMGNPIVQEARGSIFTYEDGEWHCVCYPFKKFFNAAEPYAAAEQINWASARVMQKVDGSLIKFWYHKSKWHISTNGTIDAAKASTLDGHTFYELVMRSIVDYDEFLSYLNPNYTYMFELTSPYNKIVVKYEDICQLWYLGRRNMETLNEDDYDPGFVASIRRPMLYKLSSLSECMAAAKEMDITEEGYVVVDKNFNRIKIKGEAYLAAHRLRKNGIITSKHIIEMWQNEQLDEFLIVCPEHKAFVDEVVAAITNLIQTSDKLYSSMSDITDRKLFAFQARSYRNPISSFLFARLDGKCESAVDYYKHLRIPTLTSAINPFLSIKSVGIDDEI